MTDEIKSTISSNKIKSLKATSTTLSLDDLKFILSQEVESVTCFFHKGIEACYSYNEHVKVMRIFRSYPMGEFDQIPVPDFYRLDLGLLISMYPNVERVVLPYIDRVSDCNKKILKSIDVLEHEALEIAKMKEINDNFPYLERFHINQCHGKGGPMLLFTIEELKVLAEDNRIVDLYVPNRYGSYRLLRDITLLSLL